MTVQTTNSRNDYTGNGSANVFPFEFKVFKQTDLDVVVRNTSTGVETELALTTDYTVTGAGEDEGSITLVSSGQAWLDTGNLATGYTLTIVRNMPLLQETDIRNAGQFFRATHEDQFDRDVLIAQQQQEIIDRSIKVPRSISSFNSEIPADAVVADTVPVLNSSANGYVKGPTVGEISGASANAAAAAASASAAAASQTAAGVSEANAAASELAAQNAASSSLWSDVVFLTVANSPYTVSNTDRGKLLSFDASGGAITVNLPEISTLDLSSPFRLAIKKTDTSGNAVTVNRGGTDTIDGNTNKEIGGAESGCVFVADTDPTPDQWATACFGTQTGNKIVEPFTGDGTQTTFTLASAPGSENNIQVYFSGVYQEKSTYSLSGMDVTFLTAPPNGVSIEMVIGVTASIGVPADSSVTPDKLTFKVLGDNFQTITSAYSILSSDDMIFADTAGSAFTLTLPPASSNIGKRVLIKNISTTHTNLLTLAADGSDVIIADSAFRFGFSSLSSIPIDGSYTLTLMAISSSQWRILFKDLDDRVVSATGASVLQASPVFGTRYQPSSALTANLQSGEWEFSLKLVSQVNLSATSTDFSVLNRFLLVDSSTPGTGTIFADATATHEVYVSSTRITRNLVNHEEVNPIVVTSPTDFYLEFLVASLQGGGVVSSSGYNGSFGSFSEATVFDFRRVSWATTI